MKGNLFRIFLIAFIFRLILAFGAWHPDVNNHIDWGIRFWEYSPAKFYSANVWSFTWPNQPPGTIYIFAFIRKLYEFIFSIFWLINLEIRVFPSNFIFFLEKSLYPALLKLPAILSDLGIGFIIYKILNNLKKPKAAILGTLIFLFNPVIWYNSAIWGQTDSVVNFFGLLAFYFLLNKKLFLAMFSSILSLYIKASLLIFIPIFAIVIWRQKYKVSEIIKTSAYWLVPIALLTLPFSQGEPFSWLFYLYKDKVFTQQLHVITANAFNIWTALIGIHEKPDILMLGPFTYKIWGYLLFGISFIPILYSVYKKHNVSSILWALSLTALSAFMLLTNMHERYLYPLFPYLTILALLDAKLLLIYSSISTIHLLNLYNFWWVPKVSFLINFLSASDRLAPRILGLMTFSLFVYLYSSFLRLSRAKKI